MTCLEWSRQMAALRDGKLRLTRTEGDELSRSAGKSIVDLREYVKAIENGYRRVCEELDQYRKRERVRAGLRFEDKTVQELLNNQRSVEACLGYALRAMWKVGIQDVRPVIDRMRQEMEAQIYMPYDAEEVYHDWAAQKIAADNQQPLEQTREEDLK